MVMAYVLDLVVILVFGLLVFIGYKRGVVKALSRFVGMIAAVVVAFVCSGMVAEAVFDNFVASSVEEVIAEHIENGKEDGEDALRSGVESVLEALPDPLVNLMKNQNMGTVDAILEKVELTDDLLGDPQELAAALVTKIVRPVVLALLRLVTFMAVLLVALIIVGLLSGLLDAVVGKLPIIRGVNNSLGALFGALEGVALVLILVGIVQMIATTGGEDALINQAVLDNTILTGPIAQVNPVGNFFQSVLSEFAE